MVWNKGVSEMEVVVAALQSVIEVLEKENRRLRNHNDHLMDRFMSMDFSTFKTYTSPGAPPEPAYPPGFFDAHHEMIGEIVDETSESKIT
jgi:hypothetical protein